MADEEVNLPTPDEMIASAAKFLIEGGDDEAASVLLACNVEDFSVAWTDNWNKFTYGIEVKLRGPRVAYDVLIDENHPIYALTKRAFSAVLDHNCTSCDINIRTDRMTIAPDWRAELVEIARGVLVHSQVATAEKFRLWQNLRFRSQSEIRIAEALDKLGVTFFPNCMARLTGPNRRMNMEPDFLICKGGRWGILEVDGGEFHPPERAAQEHERDRLFRSQGILVERFDAQRCYNEAHRVVMEFFRVLDGQ